MAKSDPQVIFLSANEMGGGTRPVIDAYLAGAAVTPGEFLEWSTGTLVAGNSDSGLKIARENMAADVGASGTIIDTDFASGDICPYSVPQSGDRVFAILADSQTITFGEELEITSAGHLVTQSAGTAVAFALEAVTTSGSTDRIMVEIL